jgi:hypothetical protein
MQPGWAVCDNVACPTVLGRQREIAEAEQIRRALDRR